MAKIAIFTGPQGHLSIAQAIESSLEKKHSVSLFFDRNIFFNIYTPIYQLIPAAHQIPFELSKAKRYQSAFYDIFKLQYGKKIQHFFDQTKPDLVISAYFMFNPSLGELSQKHNKPFINIITDPRTIHPLIISEQASTNLTFDETATKDCLEHAENQASCTTAGWFVKPEFEQSYDKTKVRQTLGLDPSLFTLLISSGSEGTTMVMKLLPFLAQLNKPIQIIIACGSNKALLKSIEGLKKIFNRLNTETKILTLSFVTNMHQYMQSADLVVGKAGPNSLFESVATLTPFFAITHIAGQEDGNLDIIREYNLGFVEENPFKAQELLQDIIDNPDQLNNFTPSLKKMADHNKDSKQKLLTLIDQAISQ